MSFHFSLKSGLEGVFLLKVYIISFSPFVMFLVSGGKFDDALIVVCRHVLLNAVLNVLVLVFRLFESSLCLLLFFCFVSFRVLVFLMFVEILCTFQWLDHAFSYLFSALSTFLQPFGDGEVPKDSPRGKPHLRPYTVPSLPHVRTPHVFIPIGYLAGVGNFAVEWGNDSFHFFLERLCCCEPTSIYITFLFRKQDIQKNYIIF